MACVLGIDPGVNGAVALLDEEEPAKVHVYKFPSFKVSTSGKKRTRLALDQCDQMLSTLHLINHPVLAVFEDVNGFAGNVNSTGASGFVFGRAFGCIEGMVTSLQVPRYYVPPAVWKKHYKLTGKKGPELKTASRVAASQLFPASAAEFARVCDDGPAEAALLAHYGLTHILRKEL